MRCPLKDRPVLMGAAAKRGYLLTLAEEDRALEARDVLMSEHYGGKRLLRNKHGWRRIAAIPLKTRGNAK